MVAEGIFNFNPINWHNILIYAMVFFYSIIASAVIGYMVYWLRFKYRVVVYDKRGDSNAIITVDRGRIFRLKDGTSKLKLWIKGKIIDAPANEYIYANGFGLLRKGVINVYLFGNDSYTFMNLKSLNEAKLIAIDSNIADNSRRGREAREKYQNPSFIEKYGAMAMTMLVFLILIGTLIYGISTNKAIAQSNAAASAEIVKAVEKITGADKTNPNNAPPEPALKPEIVNGYGLLT